MTLHDQTRRIYRVEYVVVLTLCVTGAAAAAVYLGQDTNWDQRNYHLYAVHAWLTGRTLTDLAPAQIQTWLNPLPYLPNYLLIQHTRPVVAGFVTGAVAGINGLLLWILARRSFDHKRDGVNRLCAGLATVLGMTGSMFVSFLGTTFGECSPMVLGALIGVTSGKHDTNHGDARRFLVAGCCLGAACGLKLTNLVYALGLAATLLVLWPSFKLRVWSLLMYAVGGAAGFLAGGGYWAAKLWLDFRNPTFPFFNAIFRSRLYEPVNFADVVYLPKSFMSAMVTSPFEWLLGIYDHSNPMFFREPRFAMVAGLLPLAMIVTVLRSNEPRRSDADADAENLASGRNFWILSLFCVFSYAIWLDRFGIQRYILTLELLSGVVLLLSLDRLLRSAKEVCVVMGLLVIVSLFWTRPPEWGRIPYGADWFGFPHSDETASPTLYVMTGWDPMAYAILYMPKADRFVRVGGNMPLEPAMPLGERVLRVIHAYTGPIRTLSMGVRDQDVPRLQRFGLVIQADSCRSLQSRMDTFWTCLLVRSPASPGVP